MISQTLVDLVVTDPIRMFMDLDKVCFRRGAVDFHKFVDGFSLVAEQAMNLSVLDSALFVFFKQRRDKIKILCWITAVFVCGMNAWKSNSLNSRENIEKLLLFSEELFHWLLRSFDIN